MLGNLCKALHLTPRHFHPLGPSSRSAVWKARPGCRAPWSGTTDSASSRQGSCPGCKRSAWRHSMREISSPVWQGLLPTLILTELMNGPGRLGKFPQVKITSLYLRDSSETGVCALSHWVVSDPLWHRGLRPARLLCPWNSPGKNTEVGCYFLLQGIFPNQGSDPSLCIQRQILYHWAIWEALWSRYRGRKQLFPRDFPGVLWPRLQAPNAGGLGFRELDPICHTRVHLLQLKTPHAITKTSCSQISFFQNAGFALLENALVFCSVSVSSCTLRLGGHHGSPACVSSLLLWTQCLLPAPTPKSPTVTYWCSGAHWEGIWRQGICG